MSLTTLEKETRKALVERNMTLTTLANDLGISLPYLYDILKGNRPAPKQRKKIVRILKLPRTLSRLEDNSYEDV